MICPVCASSIRDGLKFCPKCGNPVVSASYQEPVNDYQAPVNNQPPVNDYQAPVNDYQPPVNDYQAPVNNYQPPVNDYQASVNNYQTYEDYNYGGNEVSEVKPENKGAKTAGLICGILALVTGVCALLVGCIPLVGVYIGAFMGFFGIILAVVSLVLAKKGNGNKGLAIGGLVCSIISIAWVVLLFIIGLLGAGTSLLSELSISLL